MTYSKTLCNILFASSVFLATPVKASDYCTDLSILVDAYRSAWEESEAAFEAYWPEYNRQSNIAMNMYYQMVNSSCMGSASCMDDAYLNYRRTIDELDSEYARLQDEANDAHITYGGLYNTYTASCS